MSVSVGKSGWITTVIHHRPAAREAREPASAEALVDAFVAFGADPEARVAVLFGEGGAFCSGWDLKYGASLQGRPGPLRELDFPDDDSPPPRGGLGPTRLELDKPVIAAVAG